MGISYLSQSATVLWFLWFSYWLQDTAIYMLNTLIVLSCLAMIHTHWWYLHELSRRSLAGPGELSLAILPCSSRWDREVGIGGAAASPVSRTLFRIVNGWASNSAHTPGILMRALRAFQTVLTKVLANPDFSQGPLSESTVERSRVGLNAQILAWLFLQSSSWGGG